VTAAGDGAASLAAVRAEVRVVSPALPDAADLVPLAAAAPEPARPWRAPAPLYVRAPDARLPTPRAARPA
jgi:tRNA A37 threonylcarbamoyladenosine modification protein TsaB